MVSSGIGQANQPLQTRANLGRLGTNGTRVRAGKLVQYFGHQNTLIVPNVVHASRLEHTDPTLSNKSDSGQALGRLCLAVESKLRFQAGLMVPAGQYLPVNPVQFVLLCLAGWMQREQQAVIDYFQEAVHVLKEAFGEKQARLNDAQRIRLAAKAKKVKFGRLKEIASIVTPQTLLRWHRELVAKKYDSSRRRRPSKPTTPEEMGAVGGSDGDG